MIHLAADLNRTWVAFLLTDIELGFTFMDLGEASRLEETKCRNCQNARPVYDTVTTSLPKLALNSSERQNIEDRLLLLKARLEGVGAGFKNGVGRRRVI